MSKLDNKIKIGFDISSTRIGYYYVDSFDIVRYGIVEIDSFSYTVSTFKKLMEKLLTEVKFDFKLKGIEVYFEVSNFQNAKLTNRFHFITGIILTALERTSFCGNVAELLDFKIFNANEWFPHLIKEHYPDLSTRALNTFERKERKQMSVAAFNKEHNIHVESDDIADAYFIWKYGDICKTTEQLKELTKKRKKEIKKHVRK